MNVAGAIGRAVMGRRRAATVLDVYGNADIVLDFAGVKNGGTPFYRRDGTTYASPTAAGLFQTGSASLSGAGYTPTGTDSLSRALDFTGDYVIYAEFDPATVDPPASNPRIWDRSGGAIYAARNVSSGVYSTNPATSAPTSAARLAFARRSGTVRASFDGATVAGAGVDAATGSQFFYIGNDSAETKAWGAAIKLITFRKATLSDAEIQALGA